MAPRSALSPEQIDEFRERLVEAATHLFARDGFEGVTLRGIATELGCSAMTPYRYFDDKESIFAAVRAAAYNEFSAAQQACCDPDAEPMQVLADLGRAYVRFAVEHPDAYRLMFGLSQPNPDQYPQLREREASSWTPLRNAIGRGVDSGAMVGDPEVLAHVFWCGVHGIASLHLAGKLAHGCNIDQVLEPMMATLFRGNRPEESS